MGALCKLLIGFILMKFAVGDIESPCPDIFTYEKFFVERRVNRWDGLIHLSAPEEVKNVSLILHLKNEAYRLFGWHRNIIVYSTVLKDKNQFLFSLPHVNLSPGETVDFKVQTIYNLESSNIPELVKIQLNGITICPKDAIDDIVPFVSNEVPNLLSVNINVAAKLIPCGTVAANAKALIKSGYNVKEAKWPWHVAIYRIVNSVNIYICGGTIVGPKYVVTAAHCVTNLVTNQIYDKAEYILRFGNTRLETIGNNTQERTIDQIIVHPEFHNIYFFNDISLLKLNATLTYSDYVRPVCLWKAGMQESVVGKLGSVIGWGFNNNNTLSNALQEIQMPVVDSLTCIFSYREFYAKFITEKTFCAGFRNGSSPCSGDSGGGMFFDKENIWYLRGLVSVSVSQAGHCDPTNYNIFTDVFRHIDWIKSKIND